MLPKVVLIEDEAIIREGLLYGIDWVKFGFEVVGEAEDGEEGLELVADTEPDLIITDIHMPFMNGLQFIERVKAVRPETEIIIISGHEEFQYAQKALKMGVYEYMLKPIDVDYLERVLEQLRAKYDLRHKEASAVLSWKEQAAIGLSLEKERVLKDLLFGAIEAEEAAQLLEDFKANYYGVMILQIDDYSILTNGMDETEIKEMERLFFHAVTSSVSGGERIVAVEDKKGECMVCLSDKYRETFKTKITELCNAIREKTSAIGPFTVTAAVGKLGDSLHAVRQSYKQALEALHYKFVVGGDQNIFYKDIEMISRQAQTSKSDYNDSDLLSSIKTSDKERIRQCLFELMTDIQARGSNSYLYMQMIIGSLYIQVMKVLKDVGGSAEEIFKEPVEVYRQVMAHQTIEGMVGELLQVCLRITDYIESRKVGKFNQTIDKAKEYIKAHYAVEELSLENVATHVNMGTSYFSVIFKQETGETFIDYVTGIRMGKAKELLGISGFKAYEIAYMVGYNNPTYFSTLFKKWVGLSPTEYRNNVVKS